MAKTKIKKGCVISGGGAWGAFGAGTLARINEDYDVVAGISTGALMSPLVALQEWNKLKEAYTSVNQDSIFDKKWYRPAPFNKEGKPNLFAILYSLLLNKDSIGTTNNLRKLINEFITDEQFQTLIDRDKQIIVGVQNLIQRPSLLHYFNSSETSSDDFRDWMWASANAPFFTSLIKKEWTDEKGETHMGQWTDGGLTELIALDQVFLKGCQEIDVIVHRNVIQPKAEASEIVSLIDNVDKCVSAMRHDIAFEYFIDKIKHFNKLGVKVRVWFLPRKLSTNSLLFDKNQMLSWWQEGYDTAFDKNRLTIYESK